MPRPFTAEIGALVQLPYPETVRDALNRMSKLQVAMGGWESARPLAAFNFLYHAITSSVAYRLDDIDEPALAAAQSGGGILNPLFNYFDQAIDELADLEIFLGPIGLEDTGGRERRRSEVDVHPRYADLAARMEHGFGDEGFMRTLDVKFAECYFRALRGWFEGTPVPRAWEVLFEHWDDDQTEGPFSGALLGVNAHVNHDLSIAVLLAHETHGHQINRPSVRYDDYLLINDIFEIQTPLLHRELVGRLEAFKFVLWTVLGEVGLHDLAQFILKETREWAWVEGERMQTGKTQRPVGATALINPTTDNATGLVAEQLLEMYL